jgi:hypothetical protein
MCRKNVHRDVKINRLWVQQYNRRRGMKGADCSVIYSFECYLTVWLLSYPAAAFTIPEDVPGTHLCWRLSRPQGHSSPERIKSIKESQTLHRKSNPRPSCLHSTVTACPKLLPTVIIIIIIIIIPYSSIKKNCFQKQYMFIMGPYKTNQWAVSTMQGKDVCVAEK